jgi:hypothetical protein
MRAGLSDLIGPRHARVKHLAGKRDQCGVGHPGAVVAVAGLTLLVCTDLPQRLRVGCRVAFDRDVGGHAAHGVDTAAVAALHKQQHIGAQARRGHGHRVAVGQHAVFVAAQHLDVAARRQRDDRVCV